MKENHLFPAKLLLFGEFTVLNGSMALAIPLSLWNGKLKTRAGDPDSRLLSFVDYLDQHRIFSPDAREVFRSAINSGLYFDSDIPQGYGLGSSGALCAAVYDRFFNEGSDDLPEIKHILSSMEAYYHGTSSGMDPLISLKHAPILREHNSYQILPSIRWPEDLQVFLVDSGIARSTGSLVDQYIQWSTQEAYRLNCIRPLVHCVNHAISFFLERDVPKFRQHLQLISDLQFQFFAPMIPENISALWKSLQGHPDIVLKLCGAGGGGYFLGFAKSGTDIARLCNGFTIKLIAPES